MSSIGRSGARSTRLGASRFSRGKNRLEANAGRRSAVADTEAAVTDTHALLYFAGGSPRLGRRAAAHFDAAEARRAIVYVPVAVMWEITLLARGGRFNLRRPPREFFADLYSNPAYQAYDLTALQVLDADDLAPHLNRDPFDALICAAARDLALPVLTRDTAITDSGTVRVIW
jgi:PIN domain nuclease of toxin-antitoxin system